MKNFPFIQIEEKNYPTIIMGEDHFTGWFSKCKKYSSEKKREKEYFETISTAYELGVRGFSMSPHPTLIKILKDFKKSHPDIICISNHHWHSHYFFKDELLYKEKNIERLRASEAFYYGPSIINKCKWFQDINTKKRFSKAEIESFRLDENKYNFQLDLFESFCDFFLVGNLCASALINLGRQDIVKKEIELIRQRNFIPLGMCEGGGLSLLSFEKLNVAGNWIWINKDFSCPSVDYTLDKIKESNKPLTAYKAFSLDKGFNLNKSMSFLKNIKQIKSVVVGVKNKQEAKETFSKLHQFFD
ncbi:hypothetical protein HN789_02120 [archaeon]|nr:hypothetical protein [archaeon]MBT4021855.1 hypothetical protein [archaeon]MBT4272150.1 hypothetical protein [archaeon]MBT4460331.1 hypothetical protein [archaeon]MBT7440013.1 hypothetical protein [archaeon]